MVKVKSSFIFIILIVLVFGISACSHTESPPTGFSNPKKAVKNLLTENYGTGNYFIVNEHKIENEIYYVVNICTQELKFNPLGIDFYAYTTVYQLFQGTFLCFV